MALFGSPIKLVAAYLYELQQCNSSEGSINTQSAATNVLFEEKNRSEEDRIHNPLPFWQSPERGIACEIADSRRLQA
jgi:hypothetical protein